MSDQGFSTRALHSGEQADRPMVTRPKTMPLYETSVFVYEGLEQVDDFLSGNRDNYMYTRLGNPNQRALEQWGSSMEGGEDAHVAASGMAALLAVLASECSAGDRIAAARDIYGGTHSLLEKELQRLGVGVDFLSVENPDIVAHALRPGTRILLVETCSNPLARVADVPRLVAAAHAAGAKLVVDNTFLSPVLFQPLAHGADAVVHSTTKYINGHSDASGGLVVADRDWIGRCRRFTQNSGGHLSPFEAWLTMRGAKTIALRMERHTANAQRIAAWLESRPQVVRVHYPGNTSHPQHSLACRLFPKGTGGMMAFDLAGGLRAVERFMRSLSFIAFAPSLAGVSTTVSHPGKTSHRGLTESELRDLGITQGTIRLSVGIEDVDDIRRDLEHALDQAGAVAEPD
ncbi:MAG TPA: PLP-dependent aspartate aminotransferase family protein [Spirochaetia bacterium]|nr:PLP-dependent aspartate aminotransferase family protein [Spirochaetia bacterium]